MAFHVILADVTEADYEDTAMEEDAASGTRRGRFRISSAGPPETTLGRFRLIPQGFTTKFWIFFWRERLINLNFFQDPTMDPLRRASSAEDLL